jgi:hypothetical protein
VTGTVQAPRHRSFIVLGLIGLWLLSSACTGDGSGSGPRSSGTGGLGAPAQVRELTSIDMLRNAFNDDAGSIRLILLISPT